MLKNRQFGAIVIFFVAIVIIKIFLSLQFHTPFFLADETVYDNIASNILMGKLYSTLLYCQTYPPGYSFFLAAAHLLTTDKAVSYHIMLAINAILTSSIVFPSFFILKKYCSESTSLLGAIVVATLPSVTTYTFVLISENLFIPLFVFSLWFLIESYGTNDRIWQFIAPLSIVYLFFTRSIGLTMIIGFVASFLYFIYARARSGKALDAIKEKRTLLLSFFFFILIYVAYDMFFNAAILPYNEVSYSNAIIDMFSGIGPFITFLSLSLHEIEFLVLSTYFIVAIGVCLYAALYYKRLNDNDKRLDEKESAVLVYFIVSSFLVFIITVAHMFQAKDDPSYMIFGRYLDPLVPPMFLLGIICLSRIYKHMNVVKTITASIIICGVTIVTYVLSFPYESYKFGNTFSIYYIQEIKHLMPVYLFISLLFILFLAVYIISFGKKTLMYLFMFMIITSLFVSNYTYSYELVMSNNDEYINGIGNYLEKASNDKTIVLMDADDYNTGGGKLRWYLTRFWMNGDLIQRSSVNDTSGVYSLDKNIDYVISTKTLPYRQVANSVGGYKLYLLNNSM